MSEQSIVDDQQGPPPATEPTKKLKKTTSLTSKILRGVQSRSPQRTMRWIASLTGEADEVEGIVESLVEEVFDPDQKAPNTMSAWIEYMFAAFQEYEVEFNRAVGSRSEYKISTEPPNLGGSPTKTSPDPTSFSGKVYTKDWALLLRGNYASLDGYIIPCDQLISFSGDQSRFTKYFRIDVNLSNGVKWRLGGEEIHYSQLRSLTMQLFSGLIKVAKGQRDENATFSFLTLEQLKMQASQRPPQQAPQIPPNIFASNPIAVPGSQFVAREQVNTGRPGYPAGFPGAPQQRPPVQAQGPRPSGPPTGAQHAPHYAQGGPPTAQQQAPQHPQGGPQTGTQQALQYAQGGPQTGVQQAPQYAQGGPQTVTQQAPQYAQGGPQTVTQQAPQYAQGGPQTATQPAPQYAQGGPRTGVQQAPPGVQQRNQNEPDFEQSCLFLFRAIDRELEKHSIKGTTAFQQNDIASADLAVKRSAKLAKLKEQLLECVTDLRESKKE